jgi:membrane protease YdiL (CAAX protease family)
MSPGDIPVAVSMNRTRFILPAALILLALAGLLALTIGSLWPLPAMAGLLTLLLRFRSGTRALGLVMEMATVSLAVVLVLNRLGVNIIFVHKAAVAIILFALIQLERDDIPKIFSRRGEFYATIRISAPAALIGVAVVAVGHLVYRGNAFPIVKVPLDVMILVGIGWALLNSVSEEFIYRGLLYARLKDAAGVRAALAGQALVFGISHHWTRVPLGIPGMALSFLFALCLGWLVKRTGSLMAAIFVHFWVDLALFTVVLLRQ